MPKIGRGAAKQQIKKFSALMPEYPRKNVIPHFFLYNDIQIHT